MTARMLSLLVVAQAVESTDERDRYKAEVVDTLLGPITVNEEFL